jgi:hypothetical protein
MTTRSHLQESLASYKIETDASMTDPVRQFSLLFVGAPSAAGLEPRIRGPVGPGYKVKMAPRCLRQSWND